MRLQEEILLILANLLLEKVFSSLKSFMGILKTRVATEHTFEFFQLSIELDYSPPCVASQTAHHICPQVENHIQPIPQFCRDADWFTLERGESTSLQNHERCKTNGVQRSGYHMTSSDLCLIALTASLTASG